MGLCRTRNDGAGAAARSYAALPTRDPDRIDGLGKGRSATAHSPGAVSPSAMPVNVGGGRPRVQADLAFGACLLPI